MDGSGQEVDRTVKQRTGPSGSRLLPFSYEDCRCCLRKYSSQCELQYER